MGRCEASRASWPLYAPPNELKRVLADLFSAAIFALAEEALQTHGTTAKRYAPCERPPADLWPWRPLYEPDPLSLSPRSVPKSIKSPIERSRFGLRSRKLKGETAVTRGRLG